MDANGLIAIIAKEAETHFVGWMKYYDKPFNDLKLCAAVVQVDTWEPGQLAMEIIKETIIEFGSDIDDDKNIDFFDGDLNFELDELKTWVEETFDQGELLLLDAVLWVAMEKSLR